MLTKLKQLARNHTLPHAILLASTAEVETQETCLQFAKYLLCNKKDYAASDTICTCKSCTLLAAGTHSDFLHLSPTESGATFSIKIDAIRELVDFVQLQPQFSQFKVVVLTAIQYLNENAVNALLKTLEEPPANTILLLTVANANLLLPTLLSRCAIFASNTNNIVINQQLIIDLHDLLLKKVTNTIVIAAKWSKYKPLEVMDGLWLILHALATQQIGDERIAALATNQQFSQLWPILDQVIQIKAWLCAGKQVNVQLCLESLLINWQKSTGV